MAGALSVDIVIISIVFSVLAAVTVGLRFYCRYLKKQPMGVDDWLIVPALLFAIALGIANSVSALAGRLGEHQLIDSNGQPIVDKAATLVFSKLIFVVEVVSIPCFAFAKSSVLFFYRRIFRGSTFNLITWILIGISIAWGVSFFFATLLQCIPLELNWTTTRLTPDRNCYDAYPMYLATAGSNFIVDVMILIVPWPNIWQLQLPTRQKFAVAGIFMLGAMVCGISIARFVFFAQSVRTGEGRSADVTWYAAPPTYWTQLEAAFAVICACLPMLRPIFQGFSPESIFGSRGGRVYSDPSSKNTSKPDKLTGGENSSSIALNPINSLSRDGKPEESIPNGTIRVQQEYDLAFETAKGGAARWL